MTKRPRLTGNVVIRRLLASGCVIKRQRGSHVQIQCARCATTVQATNDSLPAGTMAAIIRQVRDCIGEEWAQ